MRSSSGSLDEEGEIVESEVEKAPPSLPSVAGPSVDRHSSRPKGSASPPPGYDDSRAARESERRPDRYNGHGNRSRSRERLRGEKRRRSEDRGDPRRHKVHYEAGAGPNNLNIRRPRVSYADIDRTEPREILPELKRPRSRSPPTPARDGDRYYRGRRSSRTRSRSPPSLRDSRGAPYGRDGGRGGYYDDRDRRGGVGDRHHDRGHWRYSDMNGNSRDRYGGERGGRDRSVPAERGRREAEAHSTKFDRQPANRDRHSTKEGYSNGKALPAETDGHNDAQQTARVEEPMDEAKLIEERRKKREAIRAKYRGQATPMLVSALGIKDSATTSAANSPGESSETVNSPASPAHVVQMSPREGTPNGIFTIAKDGAAADQRGEVVDEPSAADYDPTNDMQEDKQRNDKRRHENEVSSSAYNETKSDDREVLMPDAEEKPQNGAEKTADADDFDMFADNDDDMFADPVPESKKAQPETAKALPVVQAATQLDASLLDNWDDAEGYYKVIPGELIDNRYRVQMILGKGMFSGVVRATDMTTQKEVAIKIIRNNETMRKAGMKEMDILRKLCRADPDDKKHLVRLERYFDHKNHLCIVFENLNINLREVLKKSGIRDVGISLKAVRAYAYQMFLGLSLLRKCNILHADLKPDNVLVNESQNVLKICDLGSASDATENEITPYLVSRFYRAPEIILGVPYDFAIDMWSIGCTLYELYTGKILFTGRTNNQMLRSIMECRGKFSHKLLKRGQFTALHFDEMLNFRSMEKDKITGRDIVRTINFNKPQRELKSRLLSAASGSESEMKDLNLFIDLLDRCLNLNPEKRCTPAEALKHPFIHRTK